MTSANSRYGAGNRPAREISDDPRVVVPVSVAATPVPDVTWFAGRRMSDVVRFYESILSGIANGLIVQDRLGRIVHANETAALAVGCSSVADFVSSTLDELRERFTIFDERGHPVDLQDFPSFAVLRGAVAEERRVRFHVAATNQQFWTSVRSEPVRDENGHLIVVVSLFRKLEDDEISDVNHARLAAIFEYSHDAIITVSVDGSIKTWNPAAERLFGYLAADAIGKSVVMLLRRDRPEERARILAAIQTGSRIDRDESEWVGNDRRRIDVSVSVSPMRDATGETIGAAIVARDIADWKWLQSQYRQAQKLEALGRLASGVAHDFNNLVTVISGFSELLLMQLAPSDSRRSLVEEIARAGERASALTRQLLVFSRQQVVRPRELSLNDVVAEAEKMLRRLIGENIDFTTVFDPNLGQIEADSGQIEQVVVNLVVNARDAMPDGGKLLIETTNVELDRVHARAHPLARIGPHVVLVVSDTGVGMDAQTRAQVFEPFFTTKPLDKGTGLGLSTVHGIVKQWGGHVTLESELGQGTTFRVYFPRIDSTSSANAAVESPVAPLGGSETVLLIEDDVVVRSLVSQVLRGQGYGVLETSNGDEAQRAVREFGKPIQLLVTDVVLPGLSGRAVAERLRALQPAMKVLYLSGYGESAIGGHSALPVDAPFLPKPFRPSVLVRIVREVLDAG